MPCPGRSARRCAPRWARPRVKGTGSWPSSGRSACSPTLPRSPRSSPSSTTARIGDASAAALLFVARRLQAERIALLFAARDGDARRFDAGDLPTVVLDGVTGEDADALLSARADGAIDPVVRDRLVETTGGNPLALGELAGALTGDQLAGQAPLPAQLPLTGGVERAFLDRYRRVAESAQRVPLGAAGAA